MNLSFFCLGSLPLHTETMDTDIKRLPIFRITETCTSFVLKPCPLCTQDLYFILGPSLKLCTQAVLHAIEVQVYAHLSQFIFHEPGNHTLLETGVHLYTRACVCTSVCSPTHTHFLNRCSSSACLSPADDVGNTDTI